jgi:hypothetical protein
MLQYLAEGDYPRTKEAGPRYPLDDIFYVNQKGQTKERAFMLVVVGGNKQKMLGDWIEKYSTTKGEIDLITPWMFDQMCYEIKPMFAKHFLPKMENELMLNTMFYRDIPDQTVIEIPVPEAGTSNKIYWEVREFHRYQDAVVATPAETLTNDLLISCIGRNSNLQNFQNLRLRVFYNVKKTTRETLYFLNKGLQYYMTNGDKGDRKVYGRTDWNDEPGDNVGDWQFSGVMTCQVGTLDAFADGKLNLKTEDENILQVGVPEEGTWYYNQPSLQLVYPGT